MKWQEINESVREAYLAGFSDGFTTAQEAMVNAAETLEYDEFVPSTEATYDIDENRTTQSRVIERVRPVVRDGLPPAVSK